MAVLELGRDRAAGPLHPASQVSAAIGACRHRTRARAAIETFLALVLIALGVLALRFVLVLAVGALA